MRLVWLQELVFAEVEHEARGYEADDAAHADVAQEVLREVDARVGSQCGQYQQPQERGVQQHDGPGPDMLDAGLTAERQEKG